jgi:hypothetical protein
VGISDKDTGHRDNSAGSNVLLCQHRFSGLKFKN